MKTSLLMLIVISSTSSVLAVEIFFSEFACTYDVTNGEALVKEY